MKFQKSTFWSSCAACYILMIICVFIVFVIIPMVDNDFAGATAKDVLSIIAVILMCIVILFPLSLIFSIIYFSVNFFFDNLIKGKTVVTYRAKILAWLIAFSLPLFLCFSLNLVIGLCFTSIILLMPCTEYYLMDKMDKIKENRTIEQTTIWLPFAVWIILFLPMFSYSAVTLPVSIAEIILSIWGMIKSTRVFKSNWLLCYLLCLLISITALSFSLIATIGADEFYADLLSGLKH